MAFNWASIRPWNGSQHLAFEELCAQLAACEETPLSSRFFRKGTPDAGVECYWRLPNGDEWAWQAKFFLESPKATQWQQINSSVTTAIDKHPKLRRYFVCLPVDLPDDRTPGRKSARAKWNEYAKKWTAYARKKGTSVEFVFWGQTELARRLSDDGNRGRVWFWFDQECLGIDWFKQRACEALANARDRYSPDLNVDLPLSAHFDAIARAPAFTAKIGELYTRLRVIFKQLTMYGRLEAWRGHHEVVVLNANALFALIEPWLPTPAGFNEWHPLNRIPWDEIHQKAEHLRASVDDATAALREMRKPKSASKEHISNSDTEGISNCLHHLYEFEHAIADAMDFVCSDECMLSNLPALLLIGDAGQGKTHLLCDVVRRSVDVGRPSILLHGEQFRNSEPFSQIVQLLGLTCDSNEFLGALEAAAEANGCRAIILIDALNEGDGNRLWSKFLPGVLTRIAHSQWLGICVSVRSQYEEYIVPHTLDAARLVRIEHRGFGELSRDAATKFFQHFGIEPSTPLLLPEFSNPLFLKLFCQSLQNEGITRVPAGLRGITAIFKFYISSINRKLARPENLDFDPRESIVERAVDSLASAMARNTSQYVSLDDAKTMVNALLTARGHLTSLFHHLEAEGLISVTPLFKPDQDELEECVRFTYQRFADHLIAKRLLAEHFAKRTPQKAFSPRGALAKLVKDQHACWANRGLLDAFTIQVPELTGKELVSVVPTIAGYAPAREAFVESLIWRTPESFSKGSFRYIKDHVLAYRGTHHDFWDSHFTAATTPGHPLNADQLHRSLARIPLPKRDAFWSTFLHRQWKTGRAADRLIDWAWMEDDKSRFDDEVIRLSAITIAWFFTTSHRFLRDAATKALVRLCVPRLDILREILNQFADVNDPYVAERLYCVAYGCAMRTTDSAALGRLAKDVYDLVFADGAPPPHILLRDYARGVIEAAAHHGKAAGIDLLKVRPPYRSDWPGLEIPTLESLKPWRDWSDQKDFARSHLYQSVMEDEDFSRYVIGDLRAWSRERVGTPRKPSPKERHDRFVASLTDRQREAWDAFCNVRQNASWCRRHDKDEVLKVFKRVYAESDLDNAVASAESTLKRVLRSKAKLDSYLDAASYVEQPARADAEERFDGQLARRWIMQRIIDLGWTADRFAEFDANANRFSGYGREANKPERIGKKYQWIALHEMLARLSDNFKMCDDQYVPSSGAFNGPWDEPIRRDIDPSMLLRRTHRNNWEPHGITWWAPARFSNWTTPTGDRSWLEHTDDLPSPESLLVVTDADDTNWLSLDGYFNWQQQAPVGVRTYDIPLRNLWYMSKAYLVKESDVAALYKWARRQSWMQRWMPESHQSYSLLLGEFFWAPAFVAQDCQFYSRQGWTQRATHGHRHPPVEILVTNDGYAHESSGFDCSIEETIDIDLPCRFLVDSMKLTWRGIEGHWFDTDGNLVAFDPSVRSRGPQVLLFRKDALDAFLRTEGLAIFWTILGEKQILGGSMDAPFRGHLEVNGAYILRRGTLSGGLSTAFVGPR